LPDALKKWQEEEDLPFTLLSDPQHLVLEAWGVWGEKTIYGKKYTGVFRSHWIIGEDGMILDEQLNVSPTKSVEKGLMALKLE
jgi:thioredoxin-dependent peroxiredoxin